MLSNNFVNAMDADTGTTTNTVVTTSSKYAQTYTELLNTIHQIGIMDDEKVMATIRRCLQDEPALLNEAYNNHLSIFDYVLKTATLQIPGVDNTKVNVFDRVVAVFLDCAHTHDISLTPQNKEIFVRVAGKLNHMGVKVVNNGSSDIVSNNGYTAATNTSQQQLSVASSTAPLALTPCATQRSPEQPVNATALSIFTALRKNKLR